PNHFAELCEVDALPRHERMSLEEGNDHRYQIMTPIYRVGHHGTLRALGGDPPAPEEPLNRLEDLDVVPVLIGLKAWSYQPPGRLAEARIGMHAHAEATLSIDEPGQIIWRQRASRPSLLIVPTRRIVTAHARSMWITTDMSEYRGIRGISQ